MNNNNKILVETKERIDRFAIKISESISRPRRKFVRQAIYGIQAGRDVKLSEIARSLCEKIKLIKTENRLAHQMGKEDLTKKINRGLIKDGARRIGEDTVLAMDLSDVHKEFAKKMENLDYVWDGSEGEVGKGYWVCEVVGAEVNGEEVVPLYSEAYSQSAEGFESENKQIFKAMDEVDAVIKGRGIWTIDRGGDRKEIIVNISEKQRRFVIRMRGDKNVKDKNGQIIRLDRLAKRIRCKKEYEVKVNKEGVEEKYKVRVGMAKKIEVCGILLNIVVIRGFGKKDMILSTNAEKDCLEVLDIYLTRWKCEESFRFLKNEYNMEDVRVRSYVGIRNTVALLHAVFYFISVELGTRLKYSIVVKNLMVRAKRFFEVKIFKQYALADGICHILFDSGWQDMIKYDVKNKRKQMAFDFA